MWVLAHLTSVARRTDGGRCPVARAGFFVPWRPFTPLVARSTDPGRAARRRDGVRCTRHMVGTCRFTFGHFGRRPPAQQPYRHLQRSAARKSIRSLLQEAWTPGRPNMGANAGQRDVSAQYRHRLTCTPVARITRSLEVTHSNNRRPTVGSHRAGEQYDLLDPL